MVRQLPGTGPGRHRHRGPARHTVHPGTAGLGRRYDKGEARYRYAFGRVRPPSGERITPSGGGGGRAAGIR